MLAWTTRDGAWFGNGFRIENRSARRWLVFDKSDFAPSGVYAEPIPLADLPTLSSAKYKAETLHRAELLSAQRRRMVQVMSALAVVALLLAAYPVAALVIGAAAAAAGLELLMTWVDPLIGNVREFSQ